MKSRNETKQDHQNNTNLSNLWTNSNKNEYLSMSNDGITWLMMLILFFIVCISSYLGIYGLNEFRQCLFLNVSDRQSWDVPNGYTTHQWVGLILAVYFIPLSVVTLLLFSFHMFQWKTIQVKYKICIYLSMMAMFIWGSERCWYKYKAKNILICGVWDCYAYADDDNNGIEDDNFGFEECFGTIFFFINVLLAIAHFMLIFRLITNSDTFGKFINQNYKNKGCFGYLSTWLSKTNTSESEEGYYSINHQGDLNRNSQKTGPFGYSPWRLKSKKAMLFVSFYLLLVVPSGFLIGAYLPNIWERYNVSTLSSFIQMGTQGDPEYSHSYFETKTYSYKDGKKTVNDDDDFLPPPLDDNLPPPMDDQHVPPADDQNPPPLDDQNPPPSILKQTKYSRFLSIDKHRRVQDQPPQDDDGYLTPTVKLFPDVIIYYSFIYGVAILGLLNVLSEPFHLLMHRRIHLFKGLKVGVILLSLMFIVMIICWLLYWGHDHKFHGENRTLANRWSRTFGLTGALCLSLLLLPISRNNVWSSILGFSWEQMLNIHKFLGYSFLTCIFLHMVIMWKDWDDHGIFPHDAKWHTPLYYPYNGGNPADSDPIGDNFTVPLANVVGYIMFPMMGIFSLEKIRRKYFELFFFTHYYHVVILLFVLLHATNTGYYIMGSLTLYLLDHMVRFWSGTSVYEINNLHTTKNITEIEINLVQSSTELIIESNDILDYKNFDINNFHYIPGQYSFINIPHIAPFEWHPFTISSSPNESTLKFHIKDMGDDTFTNKLKIYANRQKSHENTTIYIDGPYGLPIHPPDYNSLIFVAGGIGITPIYSIMKQISYAIREYQYQWNNIILYFIVKEKSDLIPFIDTLHDISDNNEIEIKIFITCDKNEINIEQNIIIEEDRPNLTNLITNYINENIRINSKCCLFVCGPNEMINECDQISLDCDISFKKEVFEF